MDSKPTPKHALTSGINQSALIIGGLALYNLCKAFSSGEVVDISEEDATNIAMFIGSIVIIIKRSFTTNKPVYFTKKGKLKKS